MTGRLSFVYERALTVACPKPPCKATVGMPCVYRTSTQVMEKTIPHLERSQLAAASTTSGNPIPDTQVETSTSGVVDGATGSPSNASLFRPEIDAPHAGSHSARAADSPCSLFSVAESGEGRDVHGEVASRPTPSWIHY